MLTFAHCASTRKVLTLPGFPTSFIRMRRVVFLLGAVVSVSLSFIFSGCCTGDIRSETPHRKIALHAYVYNKCGTLEDVIADAKRMGADGVVLSNSITIGKYKCKVSPYLNKEQKDYIKKLYNDAGLKIASYGIYPGFKDEAAARAYLSFCRDMGIEYFTWEGNYKDLPEVSKIAKEYGVKIAIHHHVKRANKENLYNVPEGMRHRCMPFDNVFAVIDNGHWARESTDIVRGYRTVGDKIRILHFKDVSHFGDPKKTDTALGEGCLNLPEMLRTLDDMGFDGWFVLENESVFKNPTPAMEKSVKYLREH